jgi:hypothetical protein
MLAELSELFSCQFDPPSLSEALSVYICAAAVINNDQTNSSCNCTCAGCLHEHANRRACLPGCTATMVTLLQNAGQAYTAARPDSTNPSISMEITTGLIIPDSFRRVFSSQPLAPAHSKEKTAVEYHRTMQAALPIPELPSQSQGGGATKRSLRLPCALGTCKKAPGCSH